MQAYALEDAYSRNDGRIFLTGTQALVRLPLMQRALDRRDGLNSAGFISGYRGSPLAAYDLQLWKSRRLLEQNDIRFLPAVNESLAATACLGTQQLETEGRAKVAGVFALWYGKGPGVDQAADALKHGNMYGSSPHGGVLVVAGDDHGGVSSTFPHQSDETFIAMGMPVLHPATLEEYLTFGLFGWALSRYSGCWTGFKAVSETVESSTSLEAPQLPVFHTPDFAMPPGGVHNRWPDPPGSKDIEQRLEIKHAAVRAFAAANPIDRTIMRPAGGSLGIVTVGKAHLDTMAALASLGVDSQRAASLGIAVYKVGLVWPLESLALRRFASECREILIIEEKRGVVEQQAREVLQDMTLTRGLAIYGKRDAGGEPLIPARGELRPALLTEPIARRLAVRGVTLTVPARSEIPSESVKRSPYFCSGCPHNTSTRVPEGSRAYGGIGCHAMASWMDRSTTHLVQMGGEGVNWTGLAPFTATPHVFQNLGDGTYFHSGVLAIRQAVAAGTPVTYKILYNDAVAMTGGQPLEGTFSVGDIVRQLQAERVHTVEVVVDEQDTLTAALDLPQGVVVHPRSALDEVQTRLREIPAVTAIVYVQTCAAEKRRGRKRKAYASVARRVFINDAVCEGCGDCSIQSNCLSILPLETPWGTKRQIDQSSCNQDFSCVQGFCPSFVEVTGEREAHRKPPAPDIQIEALIAGLPMPDLSGRQRYREIMVAGIGGTGVVTIGALVTMAAHLEGLNATVLDFMGLAQKGGSVVSHIKIAGDDRSQPNRIDEGRADVVIACDTVVATSRDVLAAMRHGHTRVFASSNEQITGAFVRNRDARIPGEGLLDRLREATGRSVATVDAHELARNICGDGVFANVVLLGFAWQAGEIPVPLAALERAMELNGVAVDLNKLAFALGRVAHSAPTRLEPWVGTAIARKPENVESAISSGVQWLTDYQSASYAANYSHFVERVKRRELHATGSTELPLTLAVAQNLARLMAYKDEYEVARLYARTDFIARLRSEHAASARFAVYLAPPLLPLGKDSAGRPRKIRFGAWIFPVFAVLARLRGLRGGVFDPFGYTHERRQERELIEQYRSRIDEVVERLASGRLSSEEMSEAIRIAKLPEQVRGFGPVKQKAMSVLSRSLSALP